MFKIIALIAFSFGLVLEKGKLYYHPQMVDSNGTVVLNYSDYNEDTGFNKKMNIMDYSPLLQDSSPSNSSFNIFPTISISDLKTTLPLTKSEVSCEGVQNGYSSFLYGLYGYAAKFYEDVNISPSITGLIRSSVLKIEYKDVPDSEQELNQFQDKNISRSCIGTSYSYSFYGLQNFGVAYSNCINNTVIPIDISRCSYSSMPFETYLKGYSMGQFEKGDSQTMKNALLRFGPVQDSSIGIYIGWETINNIEQWIVVKKRQDTSESQYVKYEYYQSNEIISTSQQYSGNVIFNSDITNKCDKITTQTSISDCPCADSIAELQKDPRYNTTCKAQQSIYNDDDDDDPYKESGSGIGYIGILIIVIVSTTVLIIGIIISCCACKHFCSDSVKDGCEDCCECCGGCCFAFCGGVLIVCGCLGSVAACCCHCVEDVICMSCLSEEGDTYTDHDGVTWRVEVI